MKKYFVHMFGPVIGIESCKVIEARDAFEADLIGHEETKEYLSSFFDIVDDIDIDDSFEEPEVDPEAKWGEDYIFESDIDSYVEVYDPEKHDLYLT